HTPLVRELQRLRGDDTDGSLRFLAPLTTAQWLTLVDEHGTPGGDAAQASLVAERLERTVEKAYPTAVFAARARIGLIELRDPSTRAAVEFIDRHSAPELRGANVRRMVSRTLGEAAEADQETLIAGLQKIQRVQNFSDTWAESAALINAGADSSL